MVVFVAGIHGVGKTWLCERYARQYEVRHITASALIEQVLTSFNLSAGERVNDSDLDQQALELAVNSIVASGKSLLLEGQMVLRDKHGQQVASNTDAFARLNLAAIVLISTDVSVVAQRQSSRDATATPADLDAFQRREMQHAEQISKALGIPLLTLHAPDTHTFNQAVGACFGHSSVARHLLPPGVAQ